MEKLFSKISTTLLLLAVLAISAYAADSPMDVVKKSNDQVSAINAQNAKLDAKAKKQMLNVISSVTSWSSISDAVVSRLRGMDAKEKEEFKTKFEELLRVTSVNKLGRYRADKFEYTNEKIDGKKATVTTLALYKKEKVELIYELEQIDGKWMIVNYIVDGVDTIRNYQKQFYRLLKKKDFAGVIEIIEKNIQESESE